ncbi:MAG: hypothetical protein IKP66_09865 [Lachnospiraceae bacterium]|nr:hypothetical protein [Lachnospiraceae bacterium]
MVRYGFFNSKKLITGDYDRKYNSEDVNNYFKGAISRDGIYQFVGNQCRVITAGGMDVAVRDGKGQINYHWFEVTSNEILTIREAHATLNRWTAIIARYDAANRNIYLLTIDGTESEKPSKPQIQRTDTLRDICLAYVYVAAGVTQITSADIEDAVENIEVCGFVSTLLAGNNSVKKVVPLPIPSRSCQGEIYYLIEESKTAGKTYEKGYYYCEPSRTEYDYIDFDWTTDILSNRPAASAEYLKVLFYANDNTTWYRCVEVSENVYEWQEVVVNEVEELPEPTEELNNQFYIVGNSLYKVEKQESNYKWYMFGAGGGGGGKGDFAIIRITYPEGTQVQVTYDGDTIEAPDTSGVWIYGCDVAGIYTVGIKNTSTTKDVEITTAGQVEDVWISPQVINYALIYYLGNEFANVAGTDEERYAISTGGWTIRRTENVNSGSHYFAINGNTNFNIDNGDFDKCFIYAHYYSSYTSGVRNEDFASLGWGGLTNYQQRTPRITNINITFNSINSKTFNCGIFTGANTNTYIALQGYISNEDDYICSKELNHIYFLNYRYRSTQIYNYEKIYAIGFYKTDDISGLSDYGSDIATILSNSTALFTDTVALNWMVLNCTGDFLISALSNSNFVNVMNSSPNKAILLANEHWARFIALLSV